jgi:hypothetical protein
MTTYTNINGIRLMATGADSGTWGTNTNVNLQMLDAATKGVKAISLSGTTHTLITADGTLSDANYAVLVFGGSPSGTNTVTISPNDQSKLFVVKNNSGQSVVMTQGSGGNVTILDGNSAVVYADGNGASAQVVDVSATFGDYLTVSNNLSDLASASTARTNLGLAIGTDVQAYNADLTTLGGLSKADGNFIVGDGATWVVESGNTVLTSIGVTATTTELNVLDGITATTTELNVLDGITATTTELNYTDGVTSAIQTQLDAKALQSTTITAGTGLTGGGDLSANRTISPDIASQAEAEAGTASNKLMTPERTAQAITALSSGGMVPLGRIGIISSVSSASFSSTQFDSSKYSSYMFVLTNVTPTTDGVEFRMRTSSNGGISYDAGASDYAYTNYKLAPGFTAYADASVSFIALGQTLVGSATGEDGVSGTLTLIGAGETKTTRVAGNLNMIASDGTFVKGDVSGMRNSAAIVNGVRFYFDSSNIESGTFEMYGILKP